MTRRSRTFPAAVGLAMAGLVALVPAHAGATPSRAGTAGTPAGAASGTGRFDVRQSLSRQVQAALANESAGVAVVVERVPVVSPELVVLSDATVDLTQAEGAR